MIDQKTIDLLKQAAQESGIAMYVVDKNNKEDIAEIVKMGFEPISLQEQVTVFKCRKDDFKCLN